MSNNIEHIHTINLHATIYDTFTISRLNTDIFATTDEAKQQLVSLFPISEYEKLSIASYDNSFEVRFVFNSNSIEGSTLTIGDTALVLDGEFVPNKPGREYFAARGSADGMAYYKKALVEGKTLTEDLIKDIHERTTLDAQPAARGVYRRSPVYIRGSETVPANWTEVRGLIESLVACWQLSKLHPLYKATAFHALFEAIHPFYDGNGRTGRLLLNYMLEEAGYPPIAVKTDNRKEYLEALEEWQTSEKHDRLIDLINENVLSELNERICCISAARVESDKQPVKQHDGLSLTITDKKIATSKEKPAAQ